MSDDLNKKIKQITDVLGQDSLPDNLKGLLNMLVSSGSQDDSGQKETQTPSQKEEKPLKNDMEENMEMFRKVKKVMDRMNSNNDPRVNLLNAIKPFLNNSRQKKVSNCIKLLYMTNISKLMDETDKDNF